jgi:hypothetical protein
LRLVVLPPENWYAREEPRLAVDLALEYVRQNGTQPRYRGNRLLFLAADQGALTRLRDAARVALAWGSIVDDLDQGRLNIDLLQQRQAQQEAQKAREFLPRAARECYKWLLCPTQSSPTDTKPIVEAFPLNTSGSTIGGELQRVCDENELVITTWSPIHLRDLLKDLYWKDSRTAAGAMAFWDDSLRYLYLPRLQNKEVLAQAIRTGAGSRDFFGTAYGQDGESFVGFKFGDPQIQFDSTLLLIEPGAAATYEKAHQPEVVEKVTDPFKLIPPGSGTSGTAIINPLPPVVGPKTPRPRSFHGAVEVPAASARMRLSQVAEEVISLLCADPNASVRVTLEISAEFPDGVSDQTKRAVSENATSLGFKLSDWD